MQHILEYYKTNKNIWVYIQNCISIFQECLETYRGKDAGVKFLHSIFKAEEKIIEWLNKNEKRNQN